MTASAVVPSTLDEKIAAAAALVREELRDGVGDACLTNSFQAEDMVVLHLAREVAPDIPVLFLDTGYHFAATYEYRDRMAAEWRMNLKNILPEHTVAEQDSLLGRDLFAREPDRCCFLRKVVPLQATLARYDAWVTGVRRVEAPTRATTPLVTYDEKNGLVKLNPIAAWSEEQMQAYIDDHHVTVNPLVAEGYPSIGCRTCTVKPLHQYLRKKL